MKSHKTIFIASLAIFLMVALSITTKFGQAANLNVHCEVNGERTDKVRVDIGESVRFSVDIRNGDSPYEIDWRGDINGNDRTERVSFDRAGTYEVSVRVEDDDRDRDSDDCPDIIVGRGGSVLGSSNVFPYFTSSPPSSASIGKLYVYDVNALDPDRDSLVYNLIYGPAGMTVNPSSGLLQWVPNASQAGQSHQVQVRATKRNGNYAYQNFSVYLQNPVAVALPAPIYPSYNDGVVLSASYPSYNLETQNLKASNDEFGNVIVSYQTNLPANSRVYYSISSHLDDNTTARYENRAEGPSNTTFHQVNLGPLEFNKTYYIRAYTWTSSDSDLSGELAFVLLPGGTVASANTLTGTYRVADEYALVRVVDRGQVGPYGADASLATALSVIGAWLFSPWLLVLIIIALLAVLLLRRGRDTYISGGSGSGPVEIRS